MNVALSKRALIRIISFLAVVLLAAIGFAVQQRAAARDYRLQLENTYARALGELSSYLANISADLEKGQYVGTPTQLSQMAARVWRESGGAKSALSALPVSDLHMDNTYKFLSQVGDYAMALSKKVAAGAQLSEEDRQNAEALREYAAKLNDYVGGVERQVREGRIDVAALRTARHGGDDTEGTQPTGVSAGFEDVEQTMTGYPTLIYDGPFSDHLLTRRPRLTYGRPAVTPDAAQQAAASAARLNPGDLTRADDENSNMPSYTFKAENLSIGVTKAGGLVTYLINGREIGEERLRNDAIFRFGEDYLTSLGYENMRATYYEKADGVCTINYAATSGNVILYTDLVKVGVALDDGSVVFYDARGYINNHRDRVLDDPAITAEQALQSVNPSLTVLSERLALIPTSGQNEVLTYEFQARAGEDADAQKVLVYINASTGAEEQILLLLETPEGTLTK
ncbi:germination protein YpeB [uncultured Anaerotruncus sp.]|uniref:germination protein YpeB n=1 Tax=uncultured Anaerotruncus sp. TaxID=905011 RepID=UPI00280C3AE5|nr:germination protein YpeB [uncultured Anaerotruncus sp.]